VEFVEMEKEPLGLSMHLHSFALSGFLSATQWHEFLNEAASHIGMRPCGTPAQWDYPVCGEGGNGSTFVQPITESFLAVDTWPDHQGAYFLVCSCRPFDAAELAPLLKTFGLRIAGEVGHSLRIPVQS